MNKIVDLSVSNYGTTLNKHYDIAILPWGATEPHNLHLPYLTDCVLSHAIAVDSASKLADRYNINSMVLPPVFMGAQNPGQRGLPFCIHSRYETQKAILTDIVASLEEQGLYKLLIINGHGGNNFKNMIRDLSLDHPKFIIASSEWFKLCSPKSFFEEIGDHADEVETSVMMYYHPELVNLQEAGEGTSRQFSINELNNGNIWVPRNWEMVTKDTGIGNPAKSSALKGEKFANAIVEKYITFLHDYSRINTIDDMYCK